MKDGKKKNMSYYIYIIFSPWPIFHYLEYLRGSKRTLCYTWVGLAHPLSLIADPSGPTRYRIPKKVNSMVRPSLWCDSQDSFDMCLSVRTRFLTRPPSTRPHFLSFIRSWHLLTLSVFLLSLLSLLPYPSCALSPSITSSFPSLMSPPTSWLSNSHVPLSSSLPCLALVDLLLSPHGLSRCTLVCARTHAHTHCDYI